MRESPRDFLAFRKSGSSIKISQILYTDRFINLGKILQKTFIKARPRAGANFFYLKSAIFKHISGNISKDDMSDKYTKKRQKRKTSNPYLSFPYLKKKKEISWGEKSLINFSSQSLDGKILREIFYYN